MSNEMVCDEAPCARRIAVIGAGVSGLAAAFCLTRSPRSPQVVLYESGDRVGGLLATTQLDGYLLERTADSFLVNEQMPWGRRLATETGFADLIEPLPENRRALIVKNGRTHPVPDGFYLSAASRLADVWKSPLLSWRAKLRLAAERFVRANHDAEDESLEEFAVRRVGREVFERLVQPLVSGIYTADPARLSVRAALPQLVAMEREFGSLTAGIKQRGSVVQRSAGARYEMFRAPRWGMQSFVEHVADQLPSDSLRLRTTVSRVVRNDDGSWSVTSAETNRSPIVEAFDAVVVALPAPVAGRLLGSVSPELARELADIELAGVAVACLGYRRSQIRHPLDAFGLVVPDVERRDIVAISIASNKFEGRAPKDHVLLRVFLGGALRHDLLQRSDEALIRIAMREVNDLLSVEGTPQLTLLTRWNQVTPQYHVGHLARLHRIDAHVQRLSGLALAGNAYDGIGIPQCIRSGYRSAARVGQSSSRPG